MAKWLIDYGTSCTSIGLQRTPNHEVELLTLAGKTVQDTVIRFAEDGEHVEAWGEEAWESAILYPERTFDEFKPLAAGNLRHPKTYNGKTYSGEELGVCFIERLKLEIESMLLGGEPISPKDHTVVGYPADWSGPHQEQMVKIVRDAGFPNVRGATEPEAAALYARKNVFDTKIQDGEPFLVVDFGGGTLDLAFMEMAAGHFAYDPRRDIGGDAKLGGRDFDQALFRYFKLQIEAAANREMTSLQDIITLRKSCREAKERFCRNSLQGKAEAHYTTPAWLELLERSYTLELTKDNFLEATAALYDRFFDALDKALQLTHANPEDVKWVMLAGGSGPLLRVPGILQKVESRLPNLNPHGIRSFNRPQEAVCKGLAESFPKRTKGTRVFSGNIGEYASSGEESDGGGGADKVKTLLQDQSSWYLSGTIAVSFLFHPAYVLMAGLLSSLLVLLYNRIVIGQNVKRVHVMTYPRIYAQCLIILFMLVCGLGLFMDSAHLIFFSLRALGLGLLWYNLADTNLFLSGATKASAN